MLFKFETFYIEPVQIQDSWAICDFVVSNDDRLKRYFPKTLEQNLTPDLSKRFIDKTIKEQQLKETFLFALKENKTKKIIGLVYIKNIDWLKKQGEFAYCVGYQYEGKGLISQSVKVLSKYAFDVLGLEALQIIVHKSNISSIKVAENCNFKWQSILENEFTPVDENPLNMELYELLKNKEFHG
ncbi:GNAT family N-acetyltransferase [Mariniflexile litorale]|uniref:GNAT family N-acetyltransferase n=1 Tax=Mariniflexile litorale TaxID=3045158 RepID=A0AAU7EHT7_9FLAO|nr:GNAT family N-acetyltransferase [Mariniflexile sp. KMM 9835]MDQ8211409.1 GNAT family N-acetyltransferase [Mariniflexile sp. KMM 9835]